MPACIATSSATFSRGVEVVRARLERWLLARWYGSPGILWLLWPLELLVRAIAASRARRVRRDPPVPVIVVGNLAVGGSGKTPLVIWLAEALRARGHRVGIVSRGYGGNGPFPLYVGVQTDPVACGDEPALIARQTGLPVVVGPDRVAALLRLVEQGVDVVVSDDGLQHVALPRTVEIVVVDAQRGHGNGHCLPVGPLREPLSRLHAVDFVVSNGDQLPGSVPMVLQPRVFRRVGDPQIELSPDGFMACHGARVSAVAGIGNPSRFFATLRQLGFVPAEHPFPDHHHYSVAELALPSPVVMTSKDAVKCAGLVGADAWYLDIAVQLPADFLPALLRRAGLEDVA